MERLEGRQRKNMLAQKKNLEKANFRREVAGSSLFMFTLFLFYQAHSGEDYRHRGITVLKLLQPGSDLKPVMES